jgi:hypothetical protein
MGWRVGLPGILLSDRIHGVQFNWGQTVAAYWAAVCVVRGAGA